jgi:nucleotide-binding universal stress UspA family protein
MYKKILVPLDGSERAEAILPHVEELAEAGDAEVILLSVVELGAGEMSPSMALPGATIDYELYLKAMQKSEEESKKYLEAKANELGKKKIKVKQKLLKGNTVSAIISVADEEKVDLIAMASHGRTGLSRVFFGSVAAGVLHRAERPLLLVRAAGD